MASNTIKVRDLEAAANETECRLTEIEQKLAHTQSENVPLKQKIEQIEAHSRKFNIHVLGLPDDCEKGNPTAFMNSLLCEVFGADKLGSQSLVDIAHRTGPRPESGKYV